MTDKKISPLEFVEKAQTRDLVIGVVGAAGSGTSWIAQVLKRLLQRESIHPIIIKASCILENAHKNEWSEAKNFSVDKKIKRYQDIGDEFRKNNDNSIVAAGMMNEILIRRGEHASETPFIVICDSLRNPAEVELLRAVYGEAFWLIGAVCDEKTRHNRLIQKHNLSSNNSTEISAIGQFMERDEDSGNSYGQRVAATFQTADFFVDSSPSLRSPDVPEGEIDEWDTSKNLLPALDSI